MIDKRYAGRTGTAAAGRIALINSVGNLAGFGGPYLVGMIKEATGEFSTGLLVIAFMSRVAFTAGCALFGRRRSNIDARKTPPPLCLGRHATAPSPMSVFARKMAILPLFAEAAYA
jgi:nitrate/nitrite transporter NarK